MIDKELLKILACPSCKGALSEKDSSLICGKCALTYPVKDGIPIMLIEEAKRIGGNNG